MASARTRPWPAQSAYRSAPLLLIDDLADQLANVEGTVARIARNLLVRCRELTVQTNSLERERDLVRVLAPSLLATPCCGVLGAAMILGETAGAARFRSRHAYARFNGTARSRSGQSTRCAWVNRGGNRVVNTALHMIAVTQACGAGPGKDYVDRQPAAGKTRTKALRLLRRRLSDRVFTALIADEHLASQPAGAAAPQHCRRPRREP